MSFYLIKRNKVVLISSSWDQAKRVSEQDGAKIVTRRDLESFEEATKLAEQVSAFTGDKWLPVDHTQYTSPRYDIIEAPKVGEFVSYGFNGDYYPDSKITKISASYRRVVTESGNVYYRRNQTASWKKKGGTWGMVKGYVNERNPSF